MLRLVKLLLVPVIRFFSSRRDLLLENLALRQQLAVLKRRHSHPRLGLTDRLFWVILRRFWSGWLMNEYVHYYQDDRTHLALDKRTPAGRLLAKNGGGHGRILSTPKLGGLHHRYYGLAA